MFRDRDPQRMAAEDAGSVAIVRADGQILSVDGRAQAIGWDGAPATLIALRRSPEAELQARLRAAEREAPMRNGSAERPSGDARPGDRRRGHARRRRPHPVPERAGRAAVRLPPERDCRRERPDAARAAEPSRDDRKARSLEPRRRGRSGLSATAGSRARSRRRFDSAGADAGADRPRARPRIFAR